MGLQHRDIRKGIWHAIPTHKLEAHGRAMAQGLRPKAHGPRTTPEAQVPSPSVHSDAYMCGEITLECQVAFLCFCNNVTPICLSDLSPTSALDLGRLSQILFFSRTSLPGALALKTCVLGHGHLGLCHGTRIGRWAMSLAVGRKHMCWTYASRPHTS